MKGFFNYDNPIWHFIGKFWDVLFLNVLWLICSIPVFTIGASTTAVYYVTLRLVRDEDGYTFRSFLKSFKQNFKQATIIWLVFLFTGIVLLADLWFVLTANVFPAGTPRLFGTAFFVGLMIIWLAMITYVFPILARFYGTVKQTIRNSFLLSIRYLLYTIGMIACDVAIIALTVLAAPFLVMFGFPLIAFVNSFFLHHVFKKFIPEENANLQEVRPLFEDGDETPGSEDAALYRTFQRNDGGESGDGENAEPAEKAGEGENTEPAEKAGDQGSEESAEKAGDRRNDESAE